MFSKQLIELKIVLFSLNLHTYTHSHTHTLTHSHTLTDDPMKVHSKFLEHWHDFYSSHAHQLDASTATLLELGGGPTIHSLISACQHVSKITFSDYAESNRREIRMWKENDAKCENTTH